jgi:hypothetical protein
MRRKLTLALILAFITFTVAAAAVRRSAARTGPLVSIDCEPIAYDYLMCHAEAGGGTAPYTYQWGPPPLTGSGEWKRVGCSGVSRTISVTVTDANGETDTYSDLFYCH